MIYTQVNRLCEKSRFTFNKGIVKGNLNKGKKDIYGVHWPTRLLDSEKRGDHCEGISLFNPAVAVVRSGAVDYMLKPYEREELLSSVGRAMADKAERDQKVMLYRQVESSIKNSGG